MRLGAVCCYIETDRAIVARVDRAAVIGVKTCLTLLARGIGDTLFRCELCDERIRRRGEVVVHLPVARLCLCLLRRSGGRADGERCVLRTRCTEQSTQREECGGNVFQLRATAPFCVSRESLIK